MTPRAKYVTAFNYVVQDFMKAERENRIVKCCICGNIAEVMRGESICIDDVEVPVEHDLCENCYDNIRYALEAI